MTISKQRLAQFAERMKKITLRLMRYVPVLDEVFNVSRSVDVVVCHSVRCCSLI